MATIVTRAGKGSPLSIAEGDANFTNLNNAKLENIVDDSTPQLGGNLDVLNRAITNSVVGGDIQISPNGNGKVVLGGASVEVPINITNADGNINIIPAANIGVIEVKTDSFYLGENSSSTEVLITSAVDSNADIKIRAAGTGIIVIDDPIKLSGGDLDLTNRIITTSTTNGSIEIQNNGIGVTSIAGGAGLSIGSGYINTPLDTNLTLTANGTGAVVVNATTSGLIVVNTASSGFGSITGSASTGLALSTNAGSQGAGDPMLALSSGGGAFLTAGNTSDLTLNGNNIVIEGDTNIDVLNNFIHGLSSEAGVTGTYAPDASTGNVKYVIPSGNITINDFAAGSIVPGQSITVLIDQSSFGTSFTLTLGANFLVPGGTAPTLTATGNDLISFLCLDDGTATGGNVYIANIVNDYQ